jgi:hypothetical protein
MKKMKQPIALAQKLMLLEEFSTKLSECLAEIRVIGRLRSEGLIVTADLDTFEALRERWLGNYSEGAMMVVELFENFHLLEKLKGKK